jgi:hypothetical protein
MKKLLVIFFTLTLTLTSCQSLLKPPADTSTSIQTAIEQTMAVQNAISTFMAQTQAAVPVIPPVALPTAIPTIAIQPTIVPPTAAPSVRATATKNANCRSGPAANFDYIGVLNQGESAAVIAYNLEFGKWWQIVMADGKQCWVINDAVSLTGELALVPLVNSPKTPTPKPAPSWAGGWVLYVTNGNYGEAFDYLAMNTTIVQSGNELRFTYTGWGMSFTSNGTLSADGLIFNGYEGGSGGWTSQLYFVMDPANPNQFRGKWYTHGNTANDGWYCGSRNGAPMPNPCRI